jgi:hypothetical protein
MHQELSHRMPNSSTADSASAGGTSRATSSRLGTKTCSRAVHGAKEGAPAGVGLPGGFVHFIGGGGAVVGMLFPVLPEPTVQPDLEHGNLSLA